jgi:hypothetical protein
MKMVGLLIFQESKLARPGFTLPAPWNEIALQHVAVILAIAAQDYRAA